jgi:NADPH2:quinone reductase
MKAAVIHALGQTPRYETFADPVAGDGEVLVSTRAAALHPIVKTLAAGTHYLSTTEVPFIVGIDGVGVLNDGTRVYFGGARKPFGTFAELAAVPRKMCIPLPDGLDDVTAAAVANPGMSAWLALTWKAKVQPRETVLILGATGVAGQLAVQMARYLGAGRIIAAGRNPDSLKRLPALGADVTISLDQPEAALAEAFAREAKVAGLHVVIDYLWGAPTQALFAAMAKAPLNPSGSRIRHVEVGQSAGATITLPADLLRSSGLEISGSGFGSASIEKIFEVIPELFAFAASGVLKLETIQMPLAEVESAWTRPEPGARMVFVP